MNDPNIGFKFCPQCGFQLEIRRRNDKDRLYCRKCDKVHYRNPTVGVAVVVVEDNKLLLVKRKGSYQGMWCIPCGHVEWGRGNKRLRPPGGQGRNRTRCENRAGICRPFQFSRLDDPHRGGVV